MNTLSYAKQAHLRIMRLKVIYGGKAVSVRTAYQKITAIHPTYIHVTECAEYVGVHDDNGVGLYLDKAFVRAVQR